MAIDGDFLFVADTDNQLIRKIDLKKKSVTTIAGTGTIEGFDGAGGDGLKTSLRSPWDLSLVAGEKLFIAMAGSHQIWLMDLKTNQDQTLRRNSLGSANRRQNRRSGFCPTFGNRFGRKKSIRCRQRIEHYPRNKFSKRNGRNAGRRRSCMISATKTAKAMTCDFSIL